MGESYKLMHSGWSRYYATGLIVPFLAAISPMYLSRIFRKWDISHVVKALLFGIIVAFIAYILMNYVPIIHEKKYALNKAVLLGLLVSELSIFSISSKIPSPVLTVFFLFMYLIGIAEVE